MKDAFEDLRDLPEEDSLEWGIVVPGFQALDRATRRQSITIHVDPFDLIRRSQVAELDIPF